MHLRSSTITGLLLLVLQANAWTLQLWDGLTCRKTPRRTIKGLTDDEPVCHDLSGGTTSSFKFDQRNPQGVVGQCIATFYTQAGCGDSDKVRNSLNLCDRCGDTWNIDLAGWMVEKWMSVKVECHQEVCGQDRLSLCGGGDGCA